MPEQEKVEYTDLIVEKKYPIGYITINRPEKRNSLTAFAGGTCDQLSQAYREMGEDPEIRVFIIKGNGDCFCSGFDMSTYDEGYWKPREKGWAKGRENEAWAPISMGFPDNPESKFPDPTMWHQELWDNPTPSIALVHSFCLGAGLWNINWMDVVLATPEAVFAYPPIRYGASMVPDIVPAWILGLRRTMEMVLTGRFITAQEAYDSGLVTRIVPEDQLLEEGQKLAESIAKVPPMTNYFSKWTVHQYFEGLGIKQWHNLGMLTCFMTEQSSLPGHYWDFFELVRKKGFRQGYEEQREKWGYPDPVLNGEVERLREKNKKG